MLELSVGRAGGWFYPLYRAVGCRRWKWPVVRGEAVRFSSEVEVEWFLWVMGMRLMKQRIWCCLLVACDTKLRSVREL